MMRYNPTNQAHNHRKQRKNRRLQEIDELIQTFLPTHKHIITHSDSILSQNTIESLKRKETQCNHKTQRAATR